MTWQSDCVCSRVFFSFWGRKPLLMELLRMASVAWHHAAAACPQTWLPDAVTMHCWLPERLELPQPAANDPITTAAHPARAVLMAPLWTGRPGSRAPPRSVTFGGDQHPAVGHPGISGPPPSTRRASSGPWTGIGAADLTRGTAALSRDGRTIQPAKVQPLESGNASTPSHRSNPGSTSRRSCAARSCQPDEPINMVAGA